MYVQLNSVIVDADTANRQELATFLGQFGVHPMAQLGSVEGLAAPVGVLERLDGGGAGHLAGPVAAHPVGHGPQATGVVDEDAVLVLRPAAADVGPGARGEPHCTISSTVWPIWSLSPRRSGIVLLSRSRLRNVPLVEPRSSTKGRPSRM